jgi:valyl-tRNA synthetase
LWWGHRIPAWHCTDCGKITVVRQDPDRCEHCGSERIEQDPDVLDTWFSSGLWPFSTLGWPEDTPDLRRFYPTTVMETGYDILFFWVARMIMMGLEFTGEAPFKTVYLHGLLRDEHGRKMSKTLGNMIDPLQVMDEYGTDALRFTLLTGSSPGNDLNLSLERVEGNRNFANKLWNATRLVLGALDRAVPADDAPPEPTLADRWITARLEAVKREANRLLDAYQYGEVGRQVYDFFWGEFADWYLEIAKLQLADGAARAWQTAGIMAAVLDACLRLLHPYTPFVTEELWGRLKAACQERPGVYTPEGGWEEALIIARWPQGREGTPEDENAVLNFSLVMELIRQVRNERAERGVDPARRIGLHLAAGDRQEVLATLTQQRGVIASLARVDPDELVIRAELVPPRQAIPIVVGGIEAYLPISTMVDTAAERKRIAEELEAARKQIERLETLLAGPFSQRAPAEVVHKERDKLGGLYETRDKLQGQLDLLA